MSRTMIAAGLAVVLAGCTATPQNANAHPSHVMDFTLSPPKLAMKGVNAMEACVKKLTRVASVNNSATLHNP